MREVQRILPRRMGQFSDDGQWWWNGRNWVATSQVVLPQLPMTEFERSGSLALARAEMARGRRKFWTIGWLAVPFGAEPVNRGGFRGYRTWTIEQLELATAYLLGANEPMVAGEVSMYDLWDGWTRNLAVAVTSAHVLVFRIDSLDGQSRWIALAARSSAVTMHRVTRLFGWMYQALEICGPTGRWSILGFQAEEFNPEPVLQAWRQALEQAAGKG